LRGREKNIAWHEAIWLYQAVFEPANAANEVRSHSSGRIESSAACVMNRSRLHIFYSGHVQGVGFRYTVKSVAAGFEVTGTVRNLQDGRVEMVAEGPRGELEAFQRAIREAGLEHFIRNEDVVWSGATGEFRGFEIVR
jgi:acylphosphatase